MAQRAFGGIVSGADVGWVASDQAVRFYHLGTGTLVDTAEFPGTVLAATDLPDGQGLLVSTAAGSAGLLHCYRVGRGRARPAAVVRPVSALEVIPSAGRGGAVQVALGTVDGVVAIAALGVVDPAADEKAGGAAPARSSQPELRIVLMGSEDGGGAGASLAHEGTSVRLATTAMRVLRKAKVLLVGKETGLVEVRGLDNALLGKYQDPASRSSAPVVGFAAGPSGRAILVSYGPAPPWLAPWTRASAEESESLTVCTLLARTKKIRFLKSGAMQCAARAGIEIASARYESTLALALNDGSLVVAGAQVGPKTRFSFWHRVQRADDASAVGPVWALGGGAGASRAKRGTREAAIDVFAGTRALVVPVQLSENGLGGGPNEGEAMDEDPEGGEAQELDQIYTDFKSMRTLSERALRDLAERCRDAESMMSAGGMDQSTRARAALMARVLEMAQWLVKRGAITRRGEFQSAQALQDVVERRRQTLRSRYAKIFSLRRQMPPASGRSPGRSAGGALDAARDRVRAVITVRGSAAHGNDELAVRIDPSETVLDIKRRVSESLGIPVDQQAVVVLAGVAGGSSQAPRQRYSQPIRGPFADEEQIGRITEGGAGSSGRQVQLEVRVALSLGDALFRRQGLDYPLQSAGELLAACAWPGATLPGLQGAVLYQLCDNTSVSDAKAADPGADAFAEAFGVPLAAREEVREALLVDRAGEDDGDSNNGDSDNGDSINGEIGYKRVVCESFSSLCDAKAPLFRGRGALHALRALCHSGFLMPALRVLQATGGARGAAAREDPCASLRTLLGSGAWDDALACARENRGHEKLYSWMLDAIFRWFRKEKGLAGLVRLSLDTTERRQLEAFLAGADRPDVLLFYHISRGDVAKAVALRQSASLKTAGGNRKRRRSQRDEAYADLAGELAHCFTESLFDRESSGDAAKRRKRTKRAE